MGEDTCPQHKTKRVFHGVTSPAKSIHLGELVGLHPLPTCQGAGRGLHFVCCFPPSPSEVWLLERLRAACWEAGSSRMPAMGHACPHGAFGWLSWGGSIPKPLGQICFLSGRGDKPAPSCASKVCIEGGNRKAMFPSSAGFLPSRREHEVREVPQDPDISCLLFPSCFSGWCQCHCMSCFPVLFSNCVLGKLIRRDQPCGPTPWSAGISQEGLAEGNLLCTP